MREPLKLRHYIPTKKFSTEKGDHKKNHLNPKRVARYRKLKKGRTTVPASHLLKGRGFLLLRYHGSPLGGAQRKKNPLNRSKTQKWDQSSRINTPTNRAWEPREALKRLQTEAQNEKGLISTTY